MADRIAYTFFHLLLIAQIEAIYRLFCWINLLIFQSSNMSIASVVKYTKKSKHIKPHVITSSVEHDATLKILKHLQQEDEIGKGLKLFSFNFLKILSLLINVLIVFIFHITTAKSVN